MTFFKLKYAWKKKKTTLHTAVPPEDLDPLYQPVKHFSYKWKIALTSKKYFSWTTKGSLYITCIICIHICVFMYTIHISIHNYISIFDLWHAEKSQDLPSKSHDIGNIQKQPLHPRYWVKSCVRYSNPMWALVVSRFHRMFCWGFIRDSFTNGLLETKWDAFNGHLKLLTSAFCNWLH